MLPFTFFAALAVVGSCASPPYSVKTPPMVNPAKFADEIKEKDIRSMAQTLEKIVDKSNHDQSVGSVGHNRTMDWIEEQLNAIKSSYYVYRQEVPLFCTVEDGSVLSVGGVTIPSAPLRDSPPGSLAGPIKAARHFGCDEADYAGKSFTKHIVLIRRGGCAFALKSARAAAANASAAIIYDVDSPGPVAGASLNASKELRIVSPENRSRSFVPTLSIGSQDARTLHRLVDAMQPRRIVGALSISAHGNDQLVQRVHTYNIIAQTRSGDPDRVLVVGSHSDSSSLANSVSGIVSSLQTAKALSRHSTINAVRFAFWTAQELGQAFYNRTHESSPRFSILDAERFAPESLYSSARDLASATARWAQDSWRDNDGNVSTSSSLSDKGAASATSFSTAKRMCFLRETRKDEDEAEWTLS